METGNSYVYFALKGDNFDTDEVTNRLGIEPTDSWRQGEKGKYKSAVEFASWKLTAAKGKEYLQIDNLVDEIVSLLYDKIEIINDLKRQFELDSVVEIVLYIDTNEDASMPSLGHDLKTIEFLYRTQTKTDVDIYRFNSAYDET
ncbi:hypothetical protein PbJCM13498_35000 [Prolixibacter bellariivorans]|uniref:DUF4279 domain-containing protein n=1 Tax=Prolixibacter bellariivorans TaxID=314319 RepID=A0A5M4B4L4_9BACT|nr:DUF4279 domain-containing protein [Prolixibacter bellariivorans]GET34637.1 hypothetical protein PbJCM13498_35000 [Prolixibacter bellariivorans]